MVPRKIALIRPSSGWPFANETIVSVLEREFPELEFQIIEVRTLLKSRKDLLFFNMFYVLKEYGLDILLRKKGLRSCTLITSNMFKQIKCLLANVITPAKHIFSFQMQSLFDASQSGVPNFVYTDHTNLANLYYPGVDRRKTLKSRPWIDLERTIYHNAEVVFTRSTNISRSLTEQYGVPAEKVDCVYVGSNIVINNDKANKKYYGNNNILFVGIDWERKGGPDLVEAFKLVLRKQPNAQLTIVGCSPRLNLPNCEVVGEVSLEEMNQYYERASVFCLPTRLEPFGVVYIEALAHRLPVIATNIGAIPDFVSHGENGYLIQPGNVPELTQALLALLNDPNKCRVFGQRGYELVHSRYTWEKVGAKMKKAILAHVELPPSTSHT